MFRGQRETLFRVLGIRFVDKMADGAKGLITCESLSCVCTDVRHKFFADFFCAYS